MYLEEQDAVPWETLNVQVADITYGGRVTDIWDKRAISSILRKYFVPGLVAEDKFLFTASEAYYAPRPGNIQVTHQLHNYYLPVTNRLHVSYAYLNT